MDYTINVHGQLMALSQPQVMGILNVTPDSFFAGSRMQTEQAIAGRANQIVAEGAAMIDVGGCSIFHSIRVFSKRALESFLNNPGKRRLK